TEMGPSRTELQASHPAPSHPAAIPSCCIPSCHPILLHPILLHPFCCIPSCHPILLPSHPAIPSCSIPSCCIPSCCYPILLPSHPAAIPSCCIPSCHPILLGSSTCCCCPDTQRAGAVPGHQHRLSNSPTANSNTPGTPRPAVRGDRQGRSSVGSRACLPEALPSLLPALQGSQCCSPLQECCCPAGSSPCPSWMGYSATELLAPSATFLTLPWLPALTLSHLSHGRIFPVPAKGFAGIKCPLGAQELLASTLADTQCCPGETWAKISPWHC
uniref:Uncharacterized protein n=1 Tax=Geospiza parvula TaxID=87175 RepID=A0A8U8BJP8_GEOPR